MPNAMRHKWLQDILYDKRISQRQIADAWDVHESAVSRFIKTGMPELNPERMDKLAVLLGLSWDELRARLLERPIPRRVKVVAQDETQDNAQDPLTEAQDDAMVALAAALDAARKELGQVGYVIRCTIEREL